MWKGVPYCETVSHMINKQRHSGSHRERRTKPEIGEQTIQYVYDAVNRLTQKNYADSTSAAYDYILTSGMDETHDPSCTRRIKIALK
jgi:hypothetical protein